MDDSRPLRELDRAVELEMPIDVDLMRACLQPGDGEAGFVRLAAPKR